MTTFTATEAEGLTNNLQRIADSLDSIAGDLDGLKYLKEITTILRTSHELQDRLVRENVQLRSAANNRGVGGGAATPGRMVMTRVGEDLILKGSTYSVKEDLKAQYGATWCKELKGWKIGMEYEDSLKEFLGERVSVV